MTPIARIDIVDMKNVTALRDFMSPIGDISYISKMSQVLTDFYIFYSVLFFVHLLFVIPGNMFSIITIARTKILWTHSNIILSINGFFMIIASIVLMFVRPAAYPLLLFDERQRAIAYSVAWWAFTLSFRIGNNR